MAHGTRADGRHPQKTCDAGRATARLHAALLQCVRAARSSTTSREQQAANTVQWLQVPLLPLARPALHGRKDFRGGLDSIRHHAALLFSALLDRTLDEGE
jgi:hypothetical protein